MHFSLLSEIVLNAESQDFNLLINKIMTSVANSKYYLIKAMLCILTKIVNMKVHKKGAKYI